jgi:hypothetical protein
MSRKLATLALSVVLAAGLTSPARPDGRPHASGWGVAESPGRGELQLAFDAIEKPDGSVEGHLVMFRIVGKTYARVTATLNCLHIDGNRATMSGVVTQSVSDIPWFDPTPGVVVVFSVQDNGFGRHGTPDRCSEFIFFRDRPGAPYCHVFNVPPKLTVFGGGGFVVAP